MLFSSVWAAVAVPDAEIRVLHLSPDAPNVDVFVNDGVPAAIANLPFSSGTGYVALPADTYNFKVSPTGTTPADAVLDLDLTLDAGVKYTAVAYDEVANITPLALVDDSSGIAAGNIRLQIVHAAVGVGPVNLSARGFGTVASNVAFGDSLVLDVPAGPLSVRLDADLDGNPDFRFPVPDLGSGILVDVFAATDATGAVFLLAYLPDGSTARVDGIALGDAQVRVIHLSPDAPDVDVAVRGALAVTGLPFESSAGYLPVRPGLANIEVFAAGTSISVFARDVRLRPDVARTVVAFDDVANLQVTALRDEPCTASAGWYCIQAFHAADAFGDVNVIDESSGVLLANGFAFGTSAELVQSAGAFTLGLDVNNDFVSDATFDIPDVGDQTLVDVFAVTDAVGAPFLRVLLEDGTNVRIDPN